GDRGDDDHVEVGHVEAGGLEGLPARGRGHVAGHLVVGREMAAPDAGALGDPGVGGVHDPLQVEVRDHLAGRVVAGPEDAALGRGGRHGGEGYHPASSGRRSALYYWVTFVALTFRPL